MKNGENRFTVGDCLDMLNGLLEKGYVDRDCSMAFTINGITYCATTGGGETLPNCINREVTGELSVMADKTAFDYNY